MSNCDKNVWIQQKCSSLHWLIMLIFLRKVLKQSYRRSVNIFMLFYLQWMSNLKTFTISRISYSVFVFSRNGFIKICAPTYNFFEGKCFKMFEKHKIILTKQLEKMFLLLRSKSPSGKCPNFTMWQQATIETTHHDHSMIACSRHEYGCYSSCTSRSPFVVNRTISTTLAERLQHNSLWKKN